MKTVYRTYKFRMYPSAEQRQVLARYFGSVRFIYNHYLAERKRQYDETGKSDNYTKQAKEKLGQKNITVFGYILGGDVKESSFRTGPPFSVSSNLLLAPSMSERYRNNCFAIELPSGAVRDALNLVVHPQLIGSAITVTGTIVEQYFGYIGMKSTKACEILK